MPSRFLLLFMVVLLISAQAQEAGSVKAPASLVPGRAAFYVEVRQPGATLQELAGLLRSSCLADYPAGLQRLKQQGEISEGLESAGLLLTPEGVKEAQQFQGLALAVIGPRADGGLDYVALLQPGASNSPGLLVRRFLAGSEVKAAGEVEGVKLYRHTSFPFMGGGNPQAMWMMQRRRMPQQGQIPGGVQQFQAPGAVETDFALLPGLIVMGSPAAVKETVTLAKGKGSGPRLVDDAAFQLASKAFGDKPGLFLHTNGKGLAGEIEKLEAAKRPAWAQALQLIANPTALPSTNGSVLLVDGNLTVRGTASGAEGAKSPLLEALPTAPFGTNLLHFVPASMEAVIGFANPEGGKRWERVLEIVDSLVKAADANTRLPSRQVDRLEDDLKIKIGQDVAAKITQLVVAQGAAPSNGTTPPLLVLVETPDEDSAKTFVTDGVPKMLGALLGQRVVPTVKEVKGRALHVAELGSRGTYSFGRQGQVIVVSTDLDLTSEALSTGEKKAGLLGEARIATGLKEISGAGLVLIARPGALAAWLRGEGLLGRLPGNAHTAQALGGLGGPVGVQIGVGGLGPQRAVLPAPPGQPQPPPAGRVADPAGAKQSEGTLPPLVLGLTRKGDQVVIEGRLLEPQVGLAKLVDRLMESGPLGPAVPSGAPLLQGQFQFGPLGPGPGGVQPKPVPVPGQPPPPPMK